ncbi:MAG: hypothetical protein J7M40_08205, partial [Planctomycetes bacterium]|nr:hypothetical protein [Planctomycetota bacterium]
HYIFMTHVFLLILACTNFSALGFIRKDQSFSINYWTYSHRSGFGNEYKSEYSPPQVFAYVAAYGIGVILFVLARKHGMPAVNILGTGLCIIGLISFLIEGSHWVSTHHYSWIASFPVVMLVLLIALAIGMFKEHSIEIKVVSEPGS